MNKKEYRLMIKKNGSYVLQVKIETTRVNYRTNREEPYVYWEDVETVREK